MKKRITKILAIALALLMIVACLAACSGGSSSSGGSTAPSSSGGSSTPAPSSGGTKATLSFTIGDPDTASKTQFYKGLAEATKEATDGGLDITVFSGGTLFSHFECLEGVKSGGADMGWFYTPWNPDQYPLTEVIGLPMSFGNQMATTYAVRKAFENFPEVQAEWGDLQVLELYSGPMNYIYSSKPITTAADMKGLNVRAFAGAVTNLLADWGSSALMIGATEIYDAMDKGTIQAAIYEWSGTKSNTLYEVFKSVTYVPLVSNPFSAIMNKDSYAGVPAEYKETFEEIWASDKASFDFTEMFAQECLDSRDIGVNDYNCNEVYPTEDQLATFMPAAQSYIDGWIAKYSTADFDAGAYFEAVKGYYAEGCELYPEWNVG